MNSLLLTTMQPQTSAVHSEEGITLRVISIDTLIMKQLVSVANSSNDAINDAVEALNRVSIHNDWGCKEKNAINDYAITNKNKIKEQQENSRAFLNAVTQAANSFEKSENDIIGWGQGIDSAVSGIISVVQGTIGTTAHTGGNHPIGFPSVTEIIQDVMEGSNIGEWIESSPIGVISANNFESPIPICNFEDIKL